MSRELIPQSGAIAYRLTEDGTLEVLLITTRKGAWSIPKGLIDPGDTAEQTAIKEAEEEAGVIGLISGPPLGEWRYDKFGGTCVAALYPLRVEQELDTWQEQSFRERCWLPVEEAAERIDKAAVRPFIRALPATIQPRPEP